MILRGTYYLLLHTLTTRTITKKKINTHTKYPQIKNPQFLVIVAEFCYISVSSKPLIRDQVKCLLNILISFLLLSSSVIGNIDKGETLYLWETSLDHVWKGFGDNETHPNDQGQERDGRPNGLGILIDPNGRKYVGRWKKGIREGQRSQIHKGRGKYSGSWKNSSWWNGEKSTQTETLQEWL